MEDALGLCKQKLKWSLALNLDPTPTTKPKAVEYYTQMPLAFVGLKKAFTIAEVDLIFQAME